MSRTPSMKIVKWITGEELKNMIKHKEKNDKILKRLHFINYLYNGLSVPEASKKSGITKVTGYNWLVRWNEEGYNGIIPHFSGGRPSKLTEQEKTMLKEILTKRDDWTTKDIRNLIYQQFGVEYSLKQIRIIIANL